MKAIKTEKDLEKFWEVFYNYYGKGIYIKSDAHPCGWDWVDLSCFYDENDMMEEILTIADFSGGRYDWHIYEKHTPFQMLKDVGENWCFEINQIDWI